MRVRVFKRGGLWWVQVGDVRVSAVSWVEAWGIATRGVTR